MSLQDFKGTGICEDDDHMLFFSTFKDNFISKKEVREAWEEFKYSHLVTIQNGYVCLRPKHWLKAKERFEKKLGIDADASNIRVADATLNMKGE